MILHELISWLIILASSISPFYLLFKLLGFKGFEKLTTYVESKTVYHQLHPLVKLLIVFIVTVICAESIWWVGLFAGIVSLYFYYTLRRLRLILAFTMLQLISTVLDYAYFVSPNVIEEIFGNHLLIIWRFPEYFVYMGIDPYLTLQAIIYSLQVSMRIWGMFLYSGLIFLTTTPSQIIRSFHKMKVPMPITFAVTVALVSLPRIFDTADTVIKLQYMKGMKKWRALFESFIPLFIYEFKKAKIVSISAETRAFMVYKTRTYIDNIEFTRVDKTVTILMLFLLIVDTYLVLIGLIPSIPFHP
ncbi:energy-coupling factor transporter transmembrane component T family protein [Sulfurisphaera ohwakuensis]|uniref:energy-coupling factor transporter transmembrane component T family protein n=1 Tax=Sulfurisphaera ohwakuensis TaxID=69656 RepID=UPI0036F3AFAD